MLYYNRVPLGNLFGIHHEAVYSAIPQSLRLPAQLPTQMCPELRGFAGGRARAWVVWASPGALSPPVPVPVCELTFLCVENDIPSFSLCVDEVCTSCVQVAEGWVF